MERDINQEIEEIVKGSKVVLFMKGSRMMPQCGFSASASQIIAHYTKDFVTVNVLADPDIRQGIKDYSKWPTIPQIYVDGNFLGGSDILQDMHASGELSKVFGSEAGQPK